MSWPFLHVYFWILMVYMLKLKLKFQNLLAVKVSKAVCFQVGGEWNTYGTSISCALFIICLPIIITANCWASSTKHPPLLHWKKWRKITLFKWIFTSKYRSKQFRYLIAIFQQNSSDIIATSSCNYVRLMDWLFGVLRHFQQCFNYITVLPG